jgi:hypothetical protein
MKPNILFFAACLCIVSLDAQAAPPGAPANSADLPGQQSGWRGPVGLIAEQGGYAEATLGNNLRGLD